MATLKEDLSQPFIRNGVGIIKINLKSFRFVLIPFHVRTRYSLELSSLKAPFHQKSHGSYSFLFSLLTVDTHFVFPTSLQVRVRYGRNEQSSRSEDKLYGPAYTYPADKVWREQDLVLFQDSIIHSTVQTALDQENTNINLIKQVAGGIPSYSSSSAATSAISTLHFPLGSNTSNDSSDQSAGLHSHILSLKVNLRDVFFASPGYILLSCDYAQIELRLVSSFFP